MIWWEQFFFRIIFYKIKSHFGSTDGSRKDKDLFTIRNILQIIVMLRLETICECQFVLHEGI